MLSGWVIKTDLNLLETYIRLRKERQRTNLSAMTKSSFAEKSSKTTIVIVRLYKGLKTADLCQKELVPWIQSCP